MRTGRITLFLFMLLLVACGGGGGGRAQAVITDLAGRWDGNLLVTDDGCLLGEDSYRVSHRIEIRDEVVTLLDEADRRYQGEAISERDFEVSWNGPVTRGFTVGRRISYQDIRPRFADVEIVYFQVSQDGPDCETIWQGVVSKDDTPVW